MRMAWERTARPDYNMALAAVWEYVDRDNNEHVWALIYVYDKDHTRKDSYKYGVRATGWGGTVRWFKTLTSARKYVEREHIKYLFD